MKGSKTVLYFVMFILGAMAVSATQVVFNYCPIILNASTEAIMTQSASFNASGQLACVSIAGSNVVLDCNGTTIEYGAQPAKAATDNIAANESVGVAINASWVENINITNCRFNDINATGGGNSVFPSAAINFSHINNSIINNTIIRTNGTNGSNGILLFNTTNVIVQNTTFHIQSNNGSGSNAIYARLNITNLTIRNNHIYTNGTVGNNTAIYLHGEGVNVTIFNNSITSNGTLENNYGILLNATARCEPGVCTIALRNLNISNNTVRTMGTGNNSAVLLGLGVMNVTVAHNILMPNGTNGNNHGVELITAQNNNITNNTITPYGFSFNFGVFLRNNSDNNLVGNNTVNNRHTLERNNTGVVLNNVVINNTVVRNFIHISGNTNGSGIVLTVLANNNTVINNTIFANGTAGGTVGIFMRNSSGGNILSNTVTTNGTANNTGIELHGASHVNVANNTVRTHGNESGMHGLVLNSSNQVNVSNNTFYANGTNISHGVVLTGNSNNNTFNRNTYVAVNASSHSIYIGNVRSSLAGGGDNHFANDTLNNSGQNSFWIFQDPDMQQNFTNVTFATGNGSIRFKSLVTLNASRWNITPSNINVSYNNSFMNATNLSQANNSMFNSTAQVTLLGLNFTNPEPYFRAEDNGGTFSSCGSACTEVSFSGASAGGVYIFDVLHFSSYQAVEAPITSGGGSSSSPSGSSGSSASTASTTSMTTQSLTTQAMRTNQKVSFTVNNVQHSMTVQSVTRDTVTVRVASVPQTLVLKKGDVREISLDNDLVPDFRITVLDIFQSKATFKLDKLEKPKAPVVPATKPAEAAPEPAKAPAPAPLPAPSPAPLPRAPSELPAPEPTESSSIWLPVVLIAVLVVAGVVLLKGRMKKALK